jgi:DNA-binding response OmpR family regulator
MNDRPFRSAPTLLLVTQFADERDIYGDALRAQGFNVRVADNADDGFASSMREPPDVIVTRVPQTGTEDLLRRLKETDATKSIPVVILTSLMQPEFREKAADGGCAGYLLIPALPDTLIDEVRRVMSHRSGEAA